MRKLSQDEARLLELLVKKSSVVISDNLEEDLDVETMNDDGMGSLKLFPKDISSENRVFGKQIAECIFLDADGINVIASLNVDDKGKLFELDIWKTDFSPLIKIPEIIS
ncbi:hypothetical protein BC749_101313 [Flavobacterium araucananum]|nr:hypothetical protein BC749_101313 [Flavobacterium araucananum]